MSRSGAAVPRAFLCPAPARYLKLRRAACTASIASRRPAAGPIMPPVH
ncbi:MAG: hypothetical protein HGA65_06030 [Oscillochloris sp.]|nr:hypothetical protein [Oscillochloris sp.]